MNSNSAKIAGSPGKLRLRVAAAAMLAGGLTLSIMTAAESSATSRSVTDGVYSKDQVVRGRRGYNALCARCHGESLGGGEDSPALDAAFIKNWLGKPLGELVEYTRTEMPSDGPGKVTRKQSTDITAYMLSMNGYPTGEAELPVDLEIQNQILITPKK